MNNKKIYGLVLGILVLTMLTACQTNTNTTIPDPEPVEKPENGQVSEIVVLDSGVLIDVFDRIDEEIQN